MEMRELVSLLESKIKMKLTELSRMEKEVAITKSVIRNDLSELYKILLKNRRNKMNSEELLIIKDAIQNISLDLSEWRREVRENPDYGYRSRTISELAAALAKAQSEFTIAGKNKSNPFFKSKYADFESVVAASRPALTKNGLSVVQTILPDTEGMSLLHSILLHSSGEYIESRMRINPIKTDIQAISSYTTYIKRMAYSSLVGVVTGDESDDDGEAAVASERYEKPAQKFNQVNTTPITPEQLEQLEYELEGYPEIAEQVLEGFKISTLAKMPKEAFIKSMGKIRILKQEQPAKK